MQAYQYTHHTGNKGFQYFNIKLKRKVSNAQKKLTFLVFAGEASFAIQVLALKKLFKREKI